MTGEFDPLDVKKVSESQKCAQSVLNSNERHITYPSYQQKLSLVDFPEGMEPGKFATFGSGAIKGFVV